MRCELAVRPDCTELIYKLRNNGMRVRVDSGRHVCDLCREATAARKLITRRIRRIQEEHRNGGANGRVA